MGKSLRFPPRGESAKGSEAAASLALQGVSLGLARPPHGKGPTCTPCCVQSAGPGTKGRVVQFKTCAHLLHASAIWTQGSGVTKNKLANVQHDTCVQPPKTNNLQGLC